MTALREKAVIAGIGETEYSKDSGRTELALACEAIVRAVDDAGLSMDDIDGLVRFDMDSIDEVALDLPRSGCSNLRWMSHTGYGGTGGNAVVVHAAAAIAAGLAETVVCYRALNERSGARYGRAATWMRPRRRRLRGVPDALGDVDARARVRPVRSSPHDRVRHDERAVRRTSPWRFARHAAHEPAGDDAQADHARGPSGVADDRRPAAAVRLLHRERRRLRCHRHRGPTAPATYAIRPHGSWARRRAAARAPSGIVFRDDLAMPESVYTAADVYRSAGVGSGARSTR